MSLNNKETLRRRKAVQKGISTTRLTQRTFNNIIRKSLNNPKLIKRKIK